MITDRPVGGECFFAKLVPTANQKAGNADDWSQNAQCV